VSAARPLHPQVRAYIERAIAAGLPPLFTQTPQGARDEFAGVVRDNVPAGPELARVADHAVGVRDGAEIRVREYDPGTGAADLLVYVHGGGWVIGSVETHDALCRTLARGTGARVASVDYRLAPEHPYPRPVEDAYDALVWAAGALRGPGGRLTVAGDSAGGNLAAVCTQLARDGAGPAIDGQVLVYPVVDDDVGRESYHRYGGEGEWLSAAEMAWYWDHYVADAARRREPRASPLHAEDVAGLPPALLLLAGHDPLHDGAAAYADRLTAAGVPVDLVVYEDQVHGFLPLVGVFDQAGAAAARIASWVGGARGASGG